MGSASMGLAPHTFCRLVSRHRLWLHLVSFLPRWPHLGPRHPSSNWVAPLGPTWPSLFPRTPTLTTLIWFLTWPIVCEMVEIQFCTYCMRLASSNGLRFRAVRPDRSSSYGRAPLSLAVYAWSLARHMAVRTCRSNMLFLCCVRLL